MFEQLPSCHNLKKKQNVYSTTLNVRVTLPTLRRGHYLKRSPS